MNADSPLAQCRLLDLPRVDDCRGSLSFVEGGRHIPFEIRRIYYIYQVPDRHVRGAHAHKALHQIFIALSGSFDLDLEDGRGAKRHIHLSRPDQGFYVGPMVWRELGRFTRDAVCMVLASEVYDEADYFRDKDLFLAAAADPRPPSPGPSA
ncbi:MAG: FdtA/QdtA family cupin domain-containing protein [Akkermansiaceae bacterium]|nr:FdtA/QdtA family cupin domain-containing protein [Akkermansiaceae bacterium]